MAELADALDLGSVTTVEFCSCHCQAGKKRREIKYAGMAELADAPDLGSGGEIHAGSIPVTRTKKIGVIAVAVKGTHRKLSNRNV